MNAYALGFGTASGQGFGMRVRPVSAASGQGFGMRVRPVSAASGQGFGMRVRPVAALCVSGRSIYKHLPGVLAFDQAADARSFRGGMPIVAHPPCRTWSKYLRHQAKPLNYADEQNLGRWCVNQVIRHGGCLEQPAGSLLWADCGLPLPGDFIDPFLYTVYLEQGWFGFPSRKPTWVLVCGVPPADLAPLPFGWDGSHQVVWHKQQFSRTVRSFADWLLVNARASWWSCGAGLGTAKTPVL
jgi:hypothetical protein